MRQPFGNGGLADARIADQGRVVLRPAAQNLNDALNLLRPTDHGVELALPGGRGEVNAHLVNGRGFGPLPAFRPGAAAGLVHHLDDLRADLLQVDAQTFQDAGGDSFTLADQAEQEVLGADVVVIETACFLDGQLNDLLGARREVDVADDHAVAAADDELYGAADFV